MHYIQCTRADKFVKGNITRLVKLRSELKTMRQEFDQYKRRKQQEIKKLRKDMQAELDSVRRARDVAVRTVRVQRQRLAQVEADCMQAKEDVKGKRRDLIKQLHENNEAEMNRSHRLIHAARQRVSDAQRKSRDKVTEIRRVCESRVDETVKECEIKLHNIRQRCDADISSYETSSASVLDEMRAKHNMQTEKMMSRSALEREHMQNIANG